MKGTTFSHLQTPVLLRGRAPGTGTATPLHPQPSPRLGGMAQRGAPKQLWNEVVVSKETSSHCCPELQNGLCVCVQCVVVLVVGHPNLGGPAVSRAWGCSQSVSLAPGLSSSDLSLSPSPASSPQAPQLRII